jgi:hypothetical protein
MAFPDFIMIGAMWTGTTMLHAQLSVQPYVHMGAAAWILDGGVSRGARDQRTRSVTGLAAQVGAPWQAPSA